MDYLILLFNQFNNMKGYSKIHLDSNQYLDEFAGWLYELKKQSSMYLDFSLFYGVNLKDDDFVEINKGKYDTLSREKSIVSPFAHTLDQIKQNFIVYQGEPLIQCGSIIRKGQVVDTYCTHNPYNEYYFGSLDKLHNSGYKVCFGVFGSNCDKDKSQKTNFVKEITQNMIDNYIIKYDTVGDNYYCVVFTKKFEKEKILVR